MGAAIPVTHTLVLSLDSLVAGCALAPLLASASHRLAAAILVGSADAAASLLGSLIWLPRHGLVAAAPVMTALYGAYLIVATSLAGCGLRAASEDGRSPLPRARHLPTWMILGALAAALSVDNLLSPGGAQAVGADGLISGALMLCGLCAGARISRCWSCSVRSAWLGAGLVAATSLAVLS